MTDGTEHKTKKPAAVAAPQIHQSTMGPTSPVLRIFQIPTALELREEDPQAVAAVGLPMAEAMDAVASVTPEAEATRRAR
jgi:hypothetical protein